MVKAANWRNEAWLVGMVLLLPLVLALGLACCAERGSSGSSRPEEDYDRCLAFPPDGQRGLDLLFVIDNSDGTDTQQKLLSKQFPKLIETLRSVRFGPDGSGRPCSAKDPSGCRIPDLHIGVVSIDLGAGEQTAIPGCIPGGDKGKLQYTERIAGCNPPADPWIEYKAGKTNIAGSTTATAIEDVKKAFSCIAEIGTGGCGFEHTLESAHQAIDPVLMRNPGFLRNDPNNSDSALLAVLFLTDEDDCSAKDGSLFDPTQQGLNDPLGPLTSFRCFEFGVKCECTTAGKCDRTVQGLRKNCVPAGNYLYDVKDYVRFFAELKRAPDNSTLPGQVALAALAGPIDRVEVGMDGQTPHLWFSCALGVEASATPAIRLHHVVRALARELTDFEKEAVFALQRKQPDLYPDGGAACRASKDNFELLGFSCFEHPTSKKLMLDNFSKICTCDFSLALKALASDLAVGLHAPCLPFIPLTEGGGAACSAGEIIGTSLAGVRQVCRQSCLERADLLVKEISARGTSSISRCPPSLFDPSVTSCGQSCPCWRLVVKDWCRGNSSLSPYALQILRQGSTPAGTYVKACATSSTSLGTESPADLPQCI